MAANITLSSPAVAADGVTLTATMTGGTGSGYTVSSSAGIQINATFNGAQLRMSVSGTPSISGTTITIVLGFPIGAGWTLTRITTTTGCTFGDDGGNTYQAQTNLSFTNNSTVTVTAFPASTSGFKMIGGFTAGTTSGRSSNQPVSAMNGDNGSQYAFRATGTAVAIIAYAQTTTGGRIKVDSGAYATSAWSSSALNTWSALPVSAGLSDDGHDYVVLFTSLWLDAGTGATNNGGVILVAGATPAVSDHSGQYGDNYWLDSAPFTTYGIIERTKTTTSTYAGHTSYWIPPTQSIRFKSRSNVVALFTSRNNQSYSLYQDGVLVGTAAAGAGGGNFGRIALATSLDTTATHEYQILVHIPDQNNGTADNYAAILELAGAGIEASAVVARDKVATYGDSIAEGSGITDFRENAQFLTHNPRGKFAVMVASGGSRVSTYGRDNTANLPSDASEVWCWYGINDIGGSIPQATFEADYATMLSNIRTRCASAKIYALHPFPATNYNETTRLQFGARIATALTTSGISNAVVIPTTNWIPQNTTYLPDGLHPNTAGYAKIANRQIPIAATASISITGPSTGAPGVASSTFTCTLAGGATFTGDQVVTLTASDGTISATASGGSISGNGTGTVAVTAADGQTSFTFTYTPATAGAKTITPTVTEAGWTMPAATNYTAAAASSGAALALFL